MNQKSLNTTLIELLATIVEHYIYTAQVAAVSGDARRALDICRRATELAAQEQEKTSSKKSRKTVRTIKPTVSTNHINRAVQEMFSSPKVIAIR